MMIENALHAIFRKHIATGTLRITYPSGRTESYGDGSGPPLALRIADPAALRAIVLDPGLAVAEMYMDGRLVLEEGEIYGLIALAKANTRPEVSTPGAWVQHLRRSVTEAPVLRAVGLQARARQRRAPLRPRRAALPALPRRRHAVFLRLLRAPAHDASTRRSSPRSG